MGDELQFEKAEYGGAAALTCVSCKAPITGEYFQANGQTVCPSCRGKIAEFGQAGGQGAKLVYAIGAGVVAAFLGFVLYWGILMVTGYELGLVAIAVGWMVGWAVRWGTNQQGGPLYQGIAMVLTYISICAAWVPMLTRRGNDLMSAMVRSWTLPFEDVGSNIFGLIIIGIGLWQAWSMNRGSEIVVRGPFTAGARNA